MKSIVVSVVLLCTGVLKANQKPVGRLPYYTVDPKYQYDIERRGGTLELEPLVDTTKQTLNEKVELQKRIMIDSLKEPRIQPDTIESKIRSASRSHASCEDEKEKDKLWEQKKVLYNGWRQAPTLGIKY